MQRRGCRTVVLLAITLFAGCGTDDGYRLGRVRGKVTYLGEPITSGFVTFLPDDSKQTVGPSAMSKIAADGTYSMSTKLADDGAVIGFHKVGIMGIDSTPIVEVKEEELTPEKIMTTKGQMSKRRVTTPKKAVGETFTDRGGSVYRVLTPTKLKSPESSGVSVEVRGGSNTLNFQIKDDGTVEISS